MKDFEKYFKDNASVMLLIEPSSGRIANANKAALRFYGYDNMTSLNIADLASIPKTEVSSTVALAAQNKLQYVSHQHRLKDNSLKDINAFVSMIDTNVGEMIFATIQDITEQKRLEGELLKSEKEFRSLFENLDVGVMKQNARAEIMIANDAALKMLGFTRDELTGKSPYNSVWNVIHEDGSAFTSSTRPVPKVIATLKPVRNVIMGVEHIKMNKRKWLLVNSVPVFDLKGNLDHVISTFSDITKSKQNEENISQLNTELRDLSKHLQNGRDEERLFLAKEIHDEFAQKFAMLKMNAVRMKNKVKENEELTLMLNEQIAISENIINKSVQIFHTLHPMMLKEIGLLSTIEWYASEQLKPHNIQISIDSNIDSKIFPKEIGLTIYEVLQEILSNCIKHSNATTVSIHLFKNDEILTMSVEDDGVGFDTKLPKTQTHGFLAIRERIYSINGTLKINSVIGKGTTIKVEVPAPLAQVFRP